MVQFLIGFWFGCAATILVGAVFFSNRLRQMDEVLGKKDKSRNKKEVLKKKEVAEAIEGPHVLLVDDSRLGRTMMKEYLAKHELDIYEAENGREAIKLAQTNTFDLIFIDQHMPGMDGDETLWYLREKGNVSPGVPAVAMGSAIRKEQGDEYRTKGYADCLGKPIQENRVNEIVARLLPHKSTDEKPEGFSYRRGLTNFDGNEDVYRETLVLFADLWEERKEQLRQFLEEENMPEYAILIHAIKGDARTLGAEGLGELAYAQELQAKAGDADAVEKGFAKVMSEGDKTAEYFKRMFS